MATQAPLIACLRYTNAPAAITFLTTAFGLHPHLVIPDEADPNRIAHAQLSLGASLIMLGSVTPPSPTDTIAWRTPTQAGGVTASLYVIVPDADAHHAQAQAAGATIIAPPAPNEGYPGRSYTARDPEGQI